MGQPGQEAFKAAVEAFAAKLAVLADAVTLMRKTISSIVAQVKTTQRMQKQEESKKQKELAKEARKVEAEREKEKRKRVESVSSLREKFAGAIPVPAMTVAEFTAKRTSKYEVGKPLMITGGGDLLRTWSSAEALKSNMLKFNVFAAGFPKQKQYLAGKAVCDMTASAGIAAVREEALNCFKAAGFPFGETEDAKLQRLSASVWFTALKGGLGMPTSERHGNGVVKVHM